MLLGNVMTQLLLLLHADQFKNPLKMIAATHPLFRHVAFLDHIKASFRCVKLLRHWRMSLLLLCHSAPLLQHLGGVVVVANFLVPGGLDRCMLIRHQFENEQDDNRSRCGTSFFLDHFAVGMCGTLLEDISDVVDTRTGSSNAVVTELGYTCVYSVLHCVEYSVLQISSYSCLHSVTNSVLHISSKVSLHSSVNSVWQSSSYTSSHT